MSQHKDVAERIAWINGEFVPESRALISIHDRALAYGDAVFDTLRTFGGELFRVQEHIERLYATLAYVRIDPGIEPDELTRLVHELVERNVPALRAGEDWWVTVRVSAGIVAFDGEPVQQDGPTVIIECVPLPLRARASFFRDGVALTITERPRVNPEALNPNAKTNNYMNMMLAQREAEAVAPGSWALMPDRDGNLAEGPGCNLFVVTDGVVTTPTTEYVLAGISRAEVIDICREIDIPCLEQAVPPAAALAADEAFLTSTSLCACPVRSIDDYVLPGGAPGPVSQRIMDAFAERANYDYVGQYLAFLDSAETGTGF